MARGKRLSDDLHAVIVRQNTMGNLSGVQIARSLGYPPRTIQRILAKYRATGTVSTQRRKNCGRPRKLEYEHNQFLRGLVANRNELYVSELRENLTESGLIVSDTTIWRVLRRMGYNLKQVSKRAIERNEQHRAQFQLHMALNYTSDQLVFVDESACDRRTYLRGKVWALEGQRACRKHYFTRGKCYSILPAISLNGMLYCKIIEGSFNTELFTEFIEGLLEHMSPFPEPNSVIVMDNCAIHKAPEIRDLIESRGMKLEFLPPYSPDFNPIELAFSLIKGKLRREGQDTRDNLTAYEQLYRVVACVSTKKCHGFYHRSGYRIPTHHIPARRRTSIIRNDRFSNSISFNSY